VREIQPRYTPSHLKSIFDVLADTEPAGKTEIVETIHNLAEKARQRALVVVFSDFFTDVPALLDCFQHMRFKNHDLAIFHMLDRTEIDFEFDRPIRFVDIEGSFAMVTDPAVVRAGYQQELTRYLDAMKHGCEEFNVDYQRVFTDANYETVLAAFLLQRMRRSSASGHRP
ncbi:MAG: DUF58 domain-containing protein, partial [bacterium]